MFQRKKKLDHRKLTARNPNVQKLYDVFKAKQRGAYEGSIPCPFCTRVPEMLKKEAGTMLVVRNDFPYIVHGGVRVREHLMLTPKRHLKEFDEFSDEEARDYWQAYAGYVSRGYSATTWSRSNGRRSVPDHVHTHLILSEKMVVEDS